MNSLLKRQIRKHLSEELAQSEELKEFIDAIDKSYTNFDDQFIMQQRAMSISSEELFEANQRLSKEAEDQKGFIERLKNVLKTLKTSDLPAEVYKSKNEIDVFNLIDYIGKQTEKIVVISKQREELLSELELQNQELSDYAHMASHDLKSPLRSIQTLITWIQADCANQLNESCLKNFNLIEEQVEKMDALISGILEYSSIGKTKTEFYQVDINNLIDDLTNNIGQLNSVSIIKNTTLPTIIGDKYRFQQLFQNLITNAINYNDKEKAIIEIDCEELKEHWLFLVKDNGIGIDKAYHEKIFKTFESLNSNSTGIGLSIVRKIVDQHQGKIWIDSKLNKGTTFYFTIKKQLEGTA